MDRPPLPGGTLTVANGQIVAVEEHGVRRADVDFGDAVIVPGLVNVHTHLDLSGAAALRRLVSPSGSDAGSDFVAWLRAVVAFRRQRTPAEVRSDVAAGMAASLRFGVTAVGDVVAVEVEPPPGEPPLRRLALRELIGLTAERAATAVRLAEEWLARPESPGLRRGLSPHAPYTVRRSLFEHAAHLSGQKQCPLAIHLAESATEAELLAHHRGPLREFLQELNAWSPEELLEDADAVVATASDCGQPVLLVHANYWPPRPLPPNVSVVYCPRTHAAFGHPPYPLREWLSCDVRVCLATDSLASNPDLNVLAEAQYVYRQYPDISAERVVRMVTADAAAALGGADQLGTLTPGKVADWAVFPLSHRQGGGVPDHPAAVYAALLESAGPPQVVYVAGQPVWPEPS